MRKRKNGQKRRNDKYENAESLLHKTSTHIQCFLWRDIHCNIVSDNIFVPN